MGIMQFNKIPAAANALVAATEVAVMTIPAVLTGTGNIGVWISGDLQASGGTGVSAITLRLRYGAGITGALVDVAIVEPFAAGVTRTIPFNFYDLTNAPEQPSGAVYTLTAQQTAASGNGSVISGHIGIEV